MFKLTLKDDTDLDMSLLNCVQLYEIHLHAKYEVSVAAGSKFMTCYKDDLDLGMKTFKLTLQLLYESQMLGHNHITFSLVLHFGLYFDL